jgi:hypothetical protein
MSRGAYIHGRVRHTHARPLPAAGPGECWRSPGCPASRQRDVWFGLVSRVEWQGWLRARETGRYELEVDGSTVSPNNVTSSTVFSPAGWKTGSKPQIERRAARHILAHPRRGVAARPLQAAALGDMHTFTRGAQSTDLGRAVGKGSLRSHLAPDHRRRSGAQTE